jgi:flavodoxin
MNRQKLPAAFAVVLALFLGTLPASAKSKKVLIVYFSVTENSRTDAVSSASITTINGKKTGTITALAGMIQKATGADMYSIRTATAYPADRNAVINDAKQEQTLNARPILTTHIRNFNDYDTFIIGYPTWWYDMPQVMYSFFDEYDFSGKTIIPFNTHNGSRFSGTIETIKRLEPKAKVINDGFTVNERDAAKAQSNVDTWVKRLNLPE